MKKRTPVQWPRQIPRTQRTPLDTAHGSFLSTRLHRGSDAFDRQPITLAGYLLVLVREGSVILDHGDIEQHLHEGDACLVAPGRFELTEVPKAGFTHSEIVYFHFNQHALAAVLAGRERLEELAARISLPEQSFYPIPGLAATLEAAGTVKPLGSMTDFRQIFACLLNNRPLMAGAFAKHACFVSRFKLCLFLEDHCHGKLDASAIATLYPMGVRAFRRDCANYLGMPVNQWLFRRRIELAQAWLRRSDRSEHEVAARLGYDDMRQFRGHMKRWGQFSPLELEFLQRFGSGPRDKFDSIPFWFPSAEARTAKVRRDSIGFLDVAMTAPRKSDMIRLLKKYPDDRRGLSADPATLDAGSEVPRGTVENLATPTDRLSNIISLEAVEAWRMGESSFCLDSAMTKLAA